MTRSKRLPSTPEQIDAAVASSPWVDPCRWLTAHGIDPTLDMDGWRDKIPAHVLISALLVDRARDKAIIERLRSELDDARAESSRLRGAARTLNQAVDLAALFGTEDVA